MRLEDDDFTLFGLAPRFGVDSQEVEARWRALQAQVHPDRFAAEGPAAQRLAMQWAVRVNEAHGRLRDPVARAAYLCELRGAHVDAQRHTAMPQSFLMQQMAWREALEEADTASQVVALEREVIGQERTLLGDLARQLDGEQDLAAAVASVRSLMFLGRFRSDIHRRMEALES